METESAHPSAERGGASRDLPRPSERRSARSGERPGAVITPYRDGPLLVRGPFRLQDQNGEEIAVGRNTVALCRCGKSRSRPFCDGTHKLVRFRAPSELEARREGADRP